MPNISIQAKPFNNKEVVDIQIFLNRWDYNKVPYVDFRIYLEGQILNISPSNILYITAVEYGLFLYQNSDFKLDFDITPKLINKSVKEYEFEQAKIYLHEIFNNLLNFKNYDAFCFELARLNEIQQALGIDFDNSIEVLTRFENEFNAYVFNMKFTSDHLAPKISLYSISGKKYIQITNCIWRDTVYELDKRDFEKLIKFFRKSINIPKNIQSLYDQVLV